MVRIRLRRAGGRGQPTHRIVAADKESPRDGRFIEILGDYNPRTEPATIRVKEDRVYHWLSVGAQPSKAVLQVFNVIGLMDRYQRFQDGEELETLLEEAEEVQREHNKDPRTRRDDLQPKAAAKKEEEEAEEPEEIPVEAEEEPDVDEEDEDEVEEEQEEEIDVDEEDEDEVEEEQEEESDVDEDEEDDDEEEEETDIDEEEEEEESDDEEEDEDEEDDDEEEKDE